MQAIRRLRGTRVLGRIVCSETMRGDWARRALASSIRRTRHRYDPLAVCTSAVTEAVILSVAVRSEMAVSPGRTDRAN